MKDTKGLAIILGKLKGKEPADDDDDGSSYSTAAQEVMDAVKDGDADALASALQSFVEMCKAED